MSSRRWGTLIRPCTTADARIAAPPTKRRLPCIESRTGIDALLSRPLQTSKASDLQGTPDINTTIRRDRHPQCRVGAIVRYMRTPAFSPSSRGRLTDRDLDRFSGDTLFPRIARAVCHAKCLPRKEL